MSLKLVHPLVDEWNISVHDDTAHEIPHEKPPISYQNDRVSCSCFFSIVLMDRLMQYIKKPTPSESASVPSEIQQWTDQFKSELRNKTRSTFHEESADLYCIDSQPPCGPLSRIRTILSILHKMIQSDFEWNAMSPSSILQSDEYGHQQLLDDFCHIQRVHGEQISSHYFRDQFPCDPQCPLLRRHNRIKNAENEQRQFSPKLPKCKSKKRVEIVNTKDIVFQQELDKIHSYFLHPLEEAIVAINNSEIGEYHNMPIPRSCRSRRNLFDEPLEDTVEEPKRFHFQLTGPADFELSDTICTDSDYEDIERITATKSLRTSLSPARMTPAKSLHTVSYDTLAPPAPMTPAKSVHLTKSRDCSYSGQQEDIKWIKTLKSKLRLLSAETPSGTPPAVRDEMSRRLVGGMGMFIWQSAQYVAC